MAIRFLGRRGTGIALSMLSRARHEISPRQCEKKNLRKASQEPRMQDIPADTKKRGPAPRHQAEVTIHGQAINAVGQGAISAIKLIEDAVAIRVNPELVEPRREHSPS